MDTSLGEQMANAAFEKMRKVYREVADINAELVAATVELKYGLLTLANRIDKADEISTIRVKLDVAQMEAEQATAEYTILVRNNANGKADGFYEALATLASELDENGNLPPTVQVVYYREEPIDVWESKSAAIMQVKQKGGKAAGWRYKSRPARKYNERYTASYYPRFSE